MSTEKNQYLDAVLKTHNIELNEKKIKAYRDERKKVKEMLEGKYNARMYSPLNSGSYAKHTAINTNFDLDIVIPFKRNEFKTLPEMYDDVHEYLVQLKSDKTTSIEKVTPQRRSINLALNVDGELLDMDIVPGRELNQEQYEEDYYLNLYDTKAETSTQTNIKTHIELLTGRAVEREVVKLLKSWKTAKGEDMKSFLVELMILKAFDKDSTLADEKLYKRLSGSLEFIVDNITTIKLADPANSNNIVSDTLTNSEKELFKGKLGRMLEDIDKSHDKLTEYFTINEDHRDAVDPDVLPKYKNPPKNPGANSFA